MKSILEDEREERRHRIIAYERELRALPERIEIQCELIAQAEQELEIRRKLLASLQRQLAILKGEGGPPAE